MTEGAEVCPVRAWYAVRVRSQYERAVQLRLQSLSIEEFVPTYEVEVRWTDRVKRSIRPLFPGYVFGRFDARSEGFRVIQQTGVVQILGSNLDPTPIPDEQINTVRKLIESALPIQPSDFAIGEAVTIASGPLAGVRGIVQKLKGSTRIVVNMEILRRSVNVEVEAALVEHIQEALR